MTVATRRVEMSSPATRARLLQSPPGTGRPGPAPRRVVLDVALAVVGLGFGATVGVALTAERVSELHARGGIAMFLGNLTGLTGTYLALVMVLLVSRVPAVERVLGQDGLLRWHRRLAPWPISLIVAHAVLLTYAFAEVARVGILHEIGVFVSSYSGMLLALIGFGVLVVIAILSIYSVRRLLRRETWWAIHLGMYLAFALAFAHEIALGPSFVGHPLTLALWSAAWAATAGLVLVYRFGLPLYRTLYHDLRVHEVRTEADGVVSVVMRGRHLDRLRFSGGQFFEWRFIAPKLWWHSHPYSLSARPRPPFVRLTARAVGVHSAALGQLRPGTRVVVEGPYGAFTAHARRHRKVAFVMGGIGVTAVRSLLEDLAPGCDPVVIWRVTSPDGAVLRDEVEPLVSHLGGRLELLEGPRSAVTLDEIASHIPELSERDVYVCGRDGFVQEMTGVIERLGAPADSIHYEVYAL